MAEMTAELHSPVITANIAESSTVKADAYRATLPGSSVGKDVEIGPGLKLEGDVLSVDDVLNKFSEDDSGNLMYNGERIASVPSGGAEGQVLAKQSDDDYDYGWKNSVTLEYNSGVLSIF